jgi:hydroxymethylpyrimidine pyrophosphatase-like HAD family hydrolase/adenine/guanine phosphoribosyltransferase-like PRPP-binding protein
MLLREEKEFYESYEWALMPFLSFSTILTKMGDLSRLKPERWPDWQKKEWMLNIYFLGCAAADISDDFLTAGIKDLSKLSDYVPGVGGIVGSIRSTSEIYCKSVKRVQDKKTRTWRTQWGQVLIDLSQPLIHPQADFERYQTVLDIKLPAMLRMRFPDQLKNMHMRIPAAYRSQDLTHHDVLTLAAKLLASAGSEQGPYLVVGLRTAGSYIAPLLCGYLRTTGAKEADYFTLRPKNFMNSWFEKLVIEAAKQNSRFVLVDEPVNSGKTILKAIKLLKKYGVQSRNIIIMVPTHPAKADWLDETLRLELGEATIIRLEPEEWFKQKLLSVEEIKNVILPYFNERGYSQLKVSDTPATAAVNQELGKNPDKEFHIRLKKVVQVEAKGAQQQADLSVKLLIKSVGWGWFSYHAGLCGDRLAEFVPEVYGVRNGLMYARWLDSAGSAKQSMDEKAHDVIKISDYIATRATQLRLSEDPTPFLSVYRESGLQSIAIILSEVFGPQVSKLKRGWVRKLLETLECPVPALIDGRMNRAEWIAGNPDLHKCDFEHHGFSKTASHNIADPAYDLASAIYEFGISREKRAQFIDHYVQKTGDKAIHQRLIFFQMLCGSEAMEEALTKINMVEHADSYEHLHQRYVRAYDSLVSETAQYFSRQVLGNPVREWRTPLFVTDIDDVLDKNIFGFPATTADGVKGLSLLRSHQVCTMIDTARGLDEVRDYCRTFGFPGGIGEYGSVIWDDLQEKTAVLISDQALQQLDKVRAALHEIPGVFINPNYRFSIKAYSFGKTRTAPLPTAMIGDLFSRLGIDQLHAKASYIDTAITDKNVNKGKALLQLLAVKGLQDGRNGSVGDTESDFPMLRVTKQGYLVNNSSVELKRKSSVHRIEIMKESFQKGFLQSIIHFLHPEERQICKQCASVLDELNKKQDLLWKLTDIANWPRWRHYAHIIDRHFLESFSG